MAAICSRADGQKPDVFDEDWMGLWEVLFVKLDVGSVNGRAKVSPMIEDNVYAETVKLVAATHLALIQKYVEDQME